MQHAHRPDLMDKVVLVTGGSRGLGREMALAMAAAGAHVIVASRNLDSCRAVVAEVEALGRSALPYSCHVGRWDDLDGLVEASYARFGRVDVLVNNAGKSPLYPSLPEVTEAMYDSVFGLNLKGPFRLSVLVGTRMFDGAGGTIVNISSMASLRPRPDVVPYAAAKAGLNATTVALAHAFAPKVRVNAIVAGGFRTDISRHWTAEFAAGLAGQAALGRLGEPSEIVGAALFLAGEASSFTTGALVPVDGGTM
ncbi:SDR family NAD(P)-dependent oxidoreductase [Blastococcus tunisiensis]|uniref:NAD(P)-dependent dehydrogenase, short-chain alcohol dehydrogenase family n=1 Tax=Blastococcus tunisiensis TaxID=1798228 RepID=A0A1I2A3J6_9ACTN|nr:glucose 1-dehydrogenase [Blastococcus sp. DSM 46838]SFE38615.1 NAD(P)-dependent dehydrogenase, short-chain alcohol dehydrogenase family [Blastococcus sp. DSM 46838]